MSCRPPQSASTKGTTPSTTQRSYASCSRARSSSGRSRRYQEPPSHGVDAVELDPPGVEQRPDRVDQPERLGVLRPALRRREDQQRPAVRPVRDDAGRPAQLGRPEPDLVPPHPGGPLRRSVQHPTHQVDQVRVEGVAPAGVGVHVPVLDQPGVVALRLQRAGHQRLLSTFSSISPQDMTTGTGLEPSPLAGRRPRTP
jgi:hypothetical protein